MTWPVLMLSKDWIDLEVILKYNLPKEVVLSCCSCPLKLMFVEIAVNQALLPCFEYLRGHFKAIPSTVCSKCYRLCKFFVIDRLFSWFWLQFISCSNLLSRCFRKYYQRSVNIVGILNKTINVIMSRPLSNMWYKQYKILITIETFLVWFVSFLFYFNSKYNLT